MYGSFDGIKIYLYAYDHNPPHFHVYYGEYEALINIRTFEMMAGSLPPKQLKKVLRWALPLRELLLEEFIRLQAQ